MPHFDPIVAIITGPGPSPVAGIRISGSGSHEVASAVMPALKGELRQAVYGTIADADDGIGILFDQHSFTGEESAEVFFHGSPASRRIILEAALANGARMAEPGEFTQRAFLNGRLDLTQAEAVVDIVEAETEAQLRLAQATTGGSLRMEVNTIVAALYKELALIEAHVDFSEELGEYNREAAIRNLTDLLVPMNHLLDSMQAGKIVREGIRIAILGRPNAGKSSLLNRVLSRDRAIVTAIPGTTRDTLEESVEIAGLKCVLIDTAGIRSTNDTIEQQGVERSLDESRTADLRWYLYDAELGWSTEDEATFAALTEPKMKVANKADIKAASDDLAISALTGLGLTKLYATVATFAPDLQRPTIRERHLAPLKSARQATQDAIATLRSDVPEDLASVQIREAIASLGEITGEAAAEDMVTRIFRDFCLGK